MVQWSGACGPPLLRKRQITACFTSDHKERHTMPSGSLWELEASYSMARNISTVHILKEVKSCWIWELQNRKGVCSRSRLQCMQLLMHEWHESADPMVSQISVMGKETMWSLWQAPVEESQYKSWGSGARPCLLKNNFWYTPRSWYRQNVWP